MVKYLEEQINALKLLKKLSNIASCIRSALGSYKISVLVFAEASRKNDHGRLSFLSVLVLVNYVLAQASTILHGAPINPGDQ